MTSDWHQLEVGIVAGCTISVTVFTAAINMLVKSAEKECRGPKMRSGIRQPPIRAFMDDLTVTVAGVQGARWVLKGLEEAFEWSRMKFKPQKSRSLVIKRGKVADKYRFRVGGLEIPTVSEMPVKSLGKWFDDSCMDKNSTKQMEEQLDDWLHKTDKSGLPGKFKAWIYQHGILPRILWPFLVYEVPLSTVEYLERKIS